MLAAHPFLKDSFLLGSLFSKELRRGKLGGREPLHVPLDSRFISGSCFITLFFSRALTFCCPLHALSNAPLAFALRLALGCSRAKRRAFQVVLSDKTNHDLSVPNIGPPYFKVWCSLAMHPFEQDVF